MSAARDRRWKQLNELHQLAGEAAAARALGRDAVVTKDPEKAAVLHAAIDNYARAATPEALLRLLDELLLDMMEPPEWIRETIDEWEAEARATLSPPPRAEPLHAAETARVRFAERRAALRECGDDLQTRANAYWGYGPRAVKT